MSFIVDFIDNLLAQKIHTISNANVDRPPQRTPSKSKITDILYTRWYCHTCKIAIKECIVNNIGNALWYNNIFYYIPTTIY